MSAAARAYAVLVIIAVAIAWAVALSSPQYVGPRREYSGVYRLSWESSTFIEGAKAGTAPVYNEDNHGYLSEEGITLPPYPCGEIAGGSFPTRMESFEIRFIGRRKPGPAGHLNAARAEYLVERVIEIRSVEHMC
ncbi:MAG: hypothetical protein K2Q29_05710 [Sphingomonadales bacterium]|nr:hypothetical protein [Sphingomonadales bacterium]